MARPPKRRRPKPPVHVRNRGSKRPTKGGRADHSRPPAQRAHDGKGCVTTEPSHEERAALDPRAAFVVSPSIWPNLHLSKIYDPRTVEAIVGRVRARMSTVLLMEGTNQLTGRPIRVYIAPNGRLSFVETVNG